MLEEWVIKNNKAPYFLLGFIILTFLTIMIILFVNTGEKTPATCEQVNSTLVNLGYYLSEFKNIQTQINQKRELGYHDWHEFYNNYAMYSMLSNGTYYITIWVGNTALYAFCDEEYKGEIGEILTAIGY